MATATDVISKAFDVLNAELERESRKQSSPTGPHNLGGRADLADVGECAKHIKTLCEAQAALVDSEQEINRRAEARMNEAIAEAERAGAK